MRAVCFASRSQRSEFSPSKPVVVPDLQLREIGILNTPKVVEILPSTPYRTL